MQAAFQQSRADAGEVDGDDEYGPNVNDPTIDGSGGPKTQKRKRAAGARQQPSGKLKRQMVKFVDGVLGGLE